MTEAARWAAEGAPHGALVSAEAQHRGRGRHGRRWQSAPGESLLLTLVLRPDLEARRLGLVPLAAGLAVAEALDAFGVRAALKWPNDVRVGGRKLAGVLAESSKPRGEALVLLGIGVNVAQTSFPDDLEDAATSIRLVTGRPVAADSVLDSVLERLSAHLGSLSTAPARVLEAVEQRLERTKQPVDLRDPMTGRRIERGRIVGVAADGGLRLDTADGERVAYAGEVTLAAP